MYKVFIGDLEREACSIELEREVIVFILYVSDMFWRR